MNNKYTGQKEPRERDSPSHLIDARIKVLGAWRNEVLSRLRALIKQAVPEVIEEVKWAKASDPEVVSV